MEDVLLHDANGLVEGALVRWRRGDALGVVEEIWDRTAIVALDTGRTQNFALNAGALERVCFETGDHVQRTGSSDVGVVLAPVDGGSPTWRISFPGGRTTNLPELALRPAILEDPLARMRAGQLGRASDFNLKAVAADLWTAHRHNALVSLAHARVDLKPHQVGVAHRVITNYPYRFMLCDEVGLGKTIEAAMIIKELRARQQAARVLILVPSGLTRQWQFELKTKFNEIFAIYNRDTIAYLKNRGDVPNPWADADSVIASHTWASWSEERRKEIAAVDWDLIIVDEAHHARKQRYGAREQRTNLYRLVHDLTSRPEFTRRGVLFLTATPLQLQRHELYSLVEMVDPVLFASEDEFIGHIEGRGELNLVVRALEESGKPIDLDGQARLASALVRYAGHTDASAVELIGESSAEELALLLRSRHRLSEVLVRNRRSVVGGFQPRSAFRWEVELSPDEKQVQQLMDEILSEGYRLAEATSQNSLGFLMTTFQKLAASSSRALKTSLRKRRERLLAGATRSLKELSVGVAAEALEEDASAAEIVTQVAPDVRFEVDRFDEVIDLLDAIQVDSKFQVLAEKLFDLFGHEAAAKVIIFTQFRETQDMLFEELAKSGWGVHRFHGQLSPIQKDETVETFRDGHGPQILISTEAGGEGRNFQFCHYMVNYDLPWNPMKVEQRIGRIDRIGQEHPVVVFNFHVVDTIESRILDVLERRINLFTEAIGGLEPILGETEASIRKALRLSVEARDRELDRLERETERNITAAREAEIKMADFILDAKSYGAEIAKAALQVESPVTQEQFEQFMVHLLRSVNTWIEEPNRKGERKIMFHAPFTLERPDLVDNRDRRRVCFDPRTNVDSEFVEYFGFGHPIIDELTRRVITEDHTGAAAVRRIAGSPSGWQFNWFVQLSGNRGTSEVFPVFVSDDGTVDENYGLGLLESARRFAGETWAGSVETSGLDEAHSAAVRAVGQHAEAMQATARDRARGRAEIEQQRIEALVANRLDAARDRLASCEATLGKMKSSGEEGSRAVIPMWESNVERARAEIERINDDKERMLQDLHDQRNPTFEYDLLNVARIVPDVSAQA